eukprot:gene18298-24758_t
MSRGADADASPDVMLDSKHRPTRQTTPPFKKKQSRLLQKLLSCFRQEVPTSSESSTVGFDNQDSKSPLSRTRRQASSNSLRCPSDPQGADEATRNSAFDTGRNSEPGWTPFCILPRNLAVEDIEEDSPVIGELRQSGSNRSAADPPQHLHPHNPHPSGGAAGGEGRGAWMRQNMVGPRLRNSRALALLKANPKNTVRRHTGWSRRISQSGLKCDVPPGGFQSSTSSPVPHTLPSSQTPLHQTSSETFPASAGASQAGSVTTPTLARNSENSGTREAGKGGRERSLDASGEGSVGRHKPWMRCATMGGRCHSRTNYMLLNSGSIKYPSSFSVENLIISATTPTRMGRGSQEGESSRGSISSRSMGCIDMASTADGSKGTGRSATSVCNTLGNFSVAEHDDIMKTTYTSTANCWSSAGGDRRQAAPKTGNTKAVQSDTCSIVHHFYRGDAAPPHKLQQAQASQDGEYAGYMMLCPALPNLPLRNSGNGSPDHGPQKSCWILDTHPLPMPPITYNRVSSSNVLAAKARGNKPVKAMSSNQLVLTADRAAASEPMSADPVSMQVLMGASRSLGRSVSRPLTASKPSSASIATGGMTGQYGSKVSPESNSTGLVGQCRLNLSSAPKRQLNASQSMKTMRHTHSGTPLTNPKSPEDIVADQPIVAYQRRLGFGHGCRPANRSLPMTPCAEDIVADQSIVAYQRRLGFGHGCRPANRSLPTTPCAEDIFAG